MIIYDHRIAPQLLQTQSTLTYRRVCNQWPYRWDGSWNSQAPFLWVFLQHPCNKNFKIQTSTLFSHMHLSEAYMHRFKGTEWKAKLCNSPWKLYCTIGKSISLHDLSINLSLPKLKVWRKLSSGKASRSEWVCVTKWTLSTKFIQLAVNFSVKQTLMAILTYMITNLA